MIADPKDFDDESRIQLDMVKSLVHDLEESVMITSTEDNSDHPDILYVNPSFTELTGYEPDEVLGKTPKILQGKKTDRGVLEHLKSDLAHDRPFRGRTYNYRKNGRPFLMDWEIVSFHSKDKSKTFYLTIQREG